MEDNCHDRSLRQPPSAGHNPYLGSLRSLARSPGPALCARSPRAASAQRSAQLLFLIARSSHFTGRPCARSWHGLQLGLVPRLPRRSLAPPLARPTINPLLREAVFPLHIVYHTCSNDVVAHNSGPEPRSAFDPRERLQVVFYARRGYAPCIPSFIRLVNRW